MSVVAADAMQAIAQLLLGSPVAALVNNQIRPLSAATTDRLPLLVYEEIEGETFDHMQGSAVWERLTICFHAYAEDYATAKAVLAAMKGTPGNSGALQNFRGTVGGVQIGRAWWKGNIDSSEAPDIGQENSIASPGANYLVLYHV